MKSSKKCPKSILNIKFILNLRTYFCTTFTQIDAAPKQMKLQRSALWQIGPKDSFVGNRCHKPLKKSVALFSSRVVLEKNWDHNIWSIMWVTVISVGVTRGL